MATYYFNGSDGISDPNSVWTNDNNAIDGDINTDATCTSTGSESSNFLRIEGTNAPSTGQVISHVKGRFYTNGAQWDPYITLTVPSGGWTWSKLQHLECKQFATSFGIPGVCYIYFYTDGLAESLGSSMSNAITFTDYASKVEIEVFTTTGTHNMSRHVSVGDGASRSDRAT